MTALSRRRLYATWAMLLALDVAIQVTMKLAGDRLHGIPPGWDWAVAALSSWLVWVSLAGYVATFVLWLAILHSSSLSAAFPATALVYVFVPLAGWVLLRCLPSSLGFRQFSDLRLWRMRWCPLYRTKPKGCAICSAIRFACLPARYWQWLATALRSLPRANGRGGYLPPGGRSSILPFAGLPYSLGLHSARTECNR